MERFTVKVASAYRVRASSPATSTHSLPHNSHAIASSTHPRTSSKTLTTATSDITTHSSLTSVRNDLHTTTSLTFNTSSSSMTQSAEAVAGQVLEGSPGAVLKHLLSFPSTHRHIETTDSLLQRLYAVYDDASKLQNMQDVASMDDRRLRRLRLQYSHLSSRALLVVGQVIMYSSIFNATTSATTTTSTTTTASNTATAITTTTTTPPTTITSHNRTTTEATPPTTSPSPSLSSTNDSAVVTSTKTDTTISKGKHVSTNIIHSPVVITKGVGTAPRTLSQLMSRQSWISDEDRAGWEHLFALLRTRSASKDGKVIIPPSTESILRIMAQLAQTLQRVLLHCCQEPRDNELLATHQKVSLIIQRWIKDYTIGKENELYTESVALSTFKEEERDFKAHMSKLKHRWRSQQQKLLLACFEADHLFCLLVTLDRRFLMQHAVTEEERRMFISTVSKLSKMQQYHNEHVVFELERWRTVIKEGVVFEEGSLLHISSVKVERALQRRVAAEICNMSFIVLSATYAVVVGGHLNRAIVGFGPVYTPSWWPSIWFGHSILALLVVASIAWNWFSFDTIICGPREGESAKGATGTSGSSGTTAGTTGSNMSLEAIKRATNEEKQPYPLQLWYMAAGTCGCSKGTALLMLIVGLLAMVTIALTVMVLRGIGIVLALV